MVSFNHIGLLRCLRVFFLEINVKICYNTYMDLKMETLLSEYESITGFSKDWRQTLSIEDFLRLKDYTLKTSCQNGAGTSALQDNVKVYPDNSDRFTLSLTEESDSNIQSTKEVVTPKTNKPNVKRFIPGSSVKQVTQKELSNEEEDEVSILNSIID